MRNANRGQVLPGNNIVRGKGAFLPRKLPPALTTLHEKCISISLDIDNCPPPLGFLILSNELPRHPCAESREKTPTGKTLGRPLTSLARRRRRCKSLLVPRNYPRPRSRSRALIIARTLFLPAWRGLNKKRAALNVDLRRRERVSAIARCTDPVEQVGKAGPTVGD